MATIEAVVRVGRAEQVHVDVDAGGQAPEGDRQETGLGDFDLVQALGTGLVGGRRTGVAVEQVGAADRGRRVHEREAVDADDAGRAA
jgi:hypothetical protein